jgi:hypothetical protein
MSDILMNIRICLYLLYLIEGQRISMVNITSILLNFNCFVYKLEPLTTALQKSIKIIKQYKLTIILFIDFIF